MKVSKFGVIAVREDTRSLRRMLRFGRDGTVPQAVITAMTVRWHRGRWIALITVRAADLHPAIRHPQQPVGNEHDRWVGVDMGLTSLAVAATSEGQRVA